MTVNKARVKGRAPLREERRHPVHEVIVGGCGDGGGGGNIAMRKGSRIFGGKTKHASEAAVKSASERAEESKTVDDDTDAHSAYTNEDGEMEEEEEKEGKREREEDGEEASCLSPAASSCLGRMTREKDRKVQCLVCGKSFPDPSYQDTGSGGHAQVGSWNHHRAHEECVFRVGQRVA